MGKEFINNMSNLSKHLKNGGYVNISKITKNMANKGFKKEIKTLTKNFYQEGGSIVKTEINKIVKNPIFTWIVCLFLAAYCARVSQNYSLPSSLFWIYDNTFSKIIAFLVIIVIAYVNIPIAVMVALTYIIVMLAYNNQNSIEGFISKKNKTFIENFTNIKREILQQEQSFHEEKEETENSEENLHTSEENNEKINIYQQALRSKKDS